MQNLQYVGAPGMQRVMPLEEVTMSGEWNGVSMRQEDFEEGRSGIFVRLITLLSAITALGMLACTSDVTPTEPAVGASPGLTVKTYTAVDLGTLRGPSSEATGVEPGWPNSGREPNGGGQFPRLTPFFGQTGRWSI